jgi:hypothetical protein
LNSIAVTLSSCGDASNSYYGEKFLRVNHKLPSEERLLAKADSLDDLASHLLLAKWLLLIALDVADPSHC